MFLKKVHIDSPTRYQDINDKATQNSDYITTSILTYKVLERQILC